MILKENKIFRKMFIVTEYAALSLDMILSIEMSPLVSLDMIHSNKQMTEALIRLHGCAGWSAGLMFEKH